MVRLVVLSAVLSFAVAVPAAAQSDRSHWGVSASFMPVWEIPSSAGPLFEAEPVDMSGSEFRIGIVRGRDLAGDWGISFVRKRVKDGSTIGGDFEQSCGSTGCLPIGAIYTYEDVTMTGVAFHKFIPFATIKSRLQVGMTFGAGIARFEGNTQGEIYSADVVGSGNNVQVLARQELVTVPASDLFKIDVVPLADLQLTVAALLAPGLKVRASGGASLPGYHFISLSATYLFGSR